MGSDNQDWLKNFVGGAIAGGGISIPILFTGTHHFVEFLLKWLGVSIVAATTGLCTVAGNDFWKSYLRARVIKLFNREKKEKQNDRDGSNKIDNGPSNRVA